MTRPLAVARSLLVAAAMTTAAHAAEAADPSIAPRAGWVVIDTDLGFPDLVERTRAAVTDAKMGLVTQASASDGARGQGLTIPGNRVIGVYRNDYARRMLKASVTAGIEAPIRFYLTENADGTATLSYKTPSFVFAPYSEEGGSDLAALAEELDGVFAGIAEQATGATVPR